MATFYSSSSPPADDCSIARVAIAVAPAKRNQNKAKAMKSVVLVMALHPSRKKREKLDERKCVLQCRSRCHYCIIYGGGEGNLTQWYSISISSSYRMHHISR